MKITATTAHDLVITETDRPITTAILEHLNRGLSARLDRGEFVRDDLDTVRYQYSYTMDPLRVALLVYSAVLYHAFGRQQTIFTDLDGSEHVIDDSGEPYPRVLGDRITVEICMDEPWEDGNHLVPGFYIIILFPEEITEAQRNGLIQKAPAPLDPSMFDSGHHRCRLDYLTDLSITTPYEVAATVGSHVAKYLGEEGYLLIMLNGTTRYIAVDNSPSP